jgi:membrane protein implicated in regulation of membrane protease activity
MFLSSMILGLVGLLAMTALGVGHGSDGHGHSSHGYSDSSHPGTGHDHDSGSGTKWLALISPRVIFSLALGFGAVGLIAEKFVILALSIPLAIVGAIALERILIQPYWKLMMRFASKPAQNLESAAFSRAKAVMDFDASGSGLIELELDGQVRQVLGTLKSGQEARVTRGKTLRIESVTDAGNCIVSLID